jgi:ribosome-associated protein
MQLLSYQSLLLGHKRICVDAWLAYQDYYILLNFASPNILVCIADRDDLTHTAIRDTIEATWPGQEEDSLEPSDLARTVVDIISDKKGVDILMLDTRPVSFIADYFVIATGESERQLKAIADEIQKHLKKHALLPLGVEGAPASGWVLLDYGSVIAHLFSPEMRDYYRLEKLWARAPVVVRMQ